MDVTTRSIPRASRRSAGEAPRAIAYHITLRFCDGRVMAPTPEQRRAAARCLFRVGAGRGLVAYAMADTHGHLVALTTREGAGELARVATGGLRHALGAEVRFEPSRFVPVLDQTHLTRAVGYVLRQQQHHGIDLDPTFDGTPLPDLVGWRVLGDHADVCLERLARHVPRVTRSMLLAEFAPDLVPPTGALEIGDAAAAALGLGDLSGATHDHVRARRAAVHAATRLGQKLSLTADLLQLSARQAQRLVQQPYEPRVVHAVGWQLALREMLRARAASARTSLVLPGTK